MWDDITHALERRGFHLGGYLRQCIPNWRLEADLIVRNLRLRYIQNVFGFGWEISNRVIILRIWVAAGGIWHFHQPSTSCIIWFEFLIFVGSLYRMHTMTSYTNRHQIHQIFHHGIDSNNNICMNDKAAFYFFPQL